MPTWDQSTFMAHRVDAATELGPPCPPAEVVVPGALIAVDHDRLLAYHELGLDENAIRERLNTRWRDDNAELLEALQEWAHGPYRAALTHAREEAMHRAAQDLQRRAMLDDMLAQWGAN